MTYKSILFKNTAETSSQPEFFKDLNLDQIIESITVAKSKYNIKPYYYTPLDNIDEIYFRHEIMKDVENRNILEIFKIFSKEMESLYSRISSEKKLTYPYYRKGRELDTAERYLAMIIRLDNDLAAAALESSGLCYFREYLQTYILSEYFTGFSNSVKSLKRKLSEIKYSIYIKGSRITVQKYSGEEDYSNTVSEVFEKFRLESEHNNAIPTVTSGGMDHIEAEILSMVSKLYPHTFQELDLFSKKYPEFIDGGIKLFDREIQFYISYIEYISRFKYHGLSFCYPKIAEIRKELYFKNSFDIALAEKLLRDGSGIICNSFSLQGKERIFIITGANQGGKTTYARTFGQIHYLSSLGCPVPGTDARLYKFDRIFTLFEKEETISNLRSRLEEDITKLSEIISGSTSESIIILNEILNSTTLYDTVLLGKKILNFLSRLDAITIWVTFADELSTFDEKTVSMITKVSLPDTSLRTYKILRGKADGKAYAMMLAEKYNLAYEQIIRRID